jgi:hypothetical protein
MTAASPPLARRQPPEKTFPDQIDSSMNVTGHSLRFRAHYEHQFCVRTG